MVRKILRRRLVEEITGRSRSAIYRDIARGTFPKPVKIGSGDHSPAVGWYSDEIQAWLDARARKGDGEAA